MRPFGLAAPLLLDFAAGACAFEAVCAFARRVLPFGVGLFASTGLAAAALAIGLSATWIAHAPDSHRIAARFHVSDALIAALIIAVLAFGATPASIRNDVGARAAFALAVAAPSLAIPVWRIARDALLLRLSKIPVYIIGTGDYARHLATLVPEIAGQRFRVRGFVAPTTEGREGREVLGTCADLERLCASSGARTVIVAAQEAVGDDVLHVARLAEQGISVLSPMEFSVQSARRIPLEFLDAKAAFDLVTNAHRAEVAKRLLDALVSILGLAVLAALLPLLYVLVRLDSPGHLFYSQLRTGRFGVPFRVYKIRTMRQAPSHPASFATEDAHRITRIGAFLRKTRIDELPQFWNVLRGEMSVIGPRPEQVPLVAKLDKSIPYFSARHAVLPGITGWAQVKNGYAASVSEYRLKVSYDLYYIRYGSLGLDLEILARTLLVMLGRIGAR